MTHHTDQERAMFEAWLQANNKYHVSGYNPHNDLWEAWQAARSAPAAPVPQSIEQMAVDRYKVVPSHESMFHRWAVVAGNGTQQLYIGREGECQNMARKFMGAFLDGAFVAMQNAAPAHPAEGVPAQDWQDAVAEAAQARAAGYEGDDRKDTDPDDASFDDFAEDVDDSECVSCSGTGEGMYDGQSCVVCLGKGFL